MGGYVLRFGLPIFTYQQGECDEKNDEEDDKKLRKILGFLPVFLLFISKFDAYKNVSNFFTDFNEKCLEYSTQYYLQSG